MTGVTLRVTSECLRQVNRNLRTKLERLRSWQTADTASLRDFSGLRTEILHAAACLRRSDPGLELNDPELNREIAQYRTNLQQLAEILPVVHVRLRARRERLQAALDHLQAATCWADASKRSL
jgi:hypothetical protein